MDNHPADYAPQSPGTEPAAPSLVLASASPARRRTLEAAGIYPRVVVSGVDESSVHAETPQLLCGELARMKAQAVAARLRAEPNDGASPTADDAAGTTLVLGCDSVLGFDGEVFGKPASPAEATARWRRMRGRSGELHTGHVLVEVDSGRTVEAVATSRVHFGTLTDSEIGTYVATGEPLAVAGGFTIDGLGGPFVERIEGDPGTVVGLSLPLLRRLLADLGLPITALWRTPARAG